MLDSLKLVNWDRVHLEFHCGLFPDAFHLDPVAVAVDFRLKEKIPRVLHRRFDGAVREYHFQVPAVVTLLLDAGLCGLSRSRIQDFRRRHR